MTIYLYVKTHNVTGLKYLGKTESKDPHKYPGSGTYWKSHLKKHGKDYRTEIIKECHTKDEFSYWGLFYSNLWNIVESNEWANLKEETGDARGKLSAESRNKISIAGLGRPPPNKGHKGAVGFWKGKTRSVGDRIKISKGRTGKGTGHHRAHTNETKQKIKAARSLQVISEETKEKIGNSNRGKSKPLATCPHCSKTGGISAMTRWHFDRCSFIRQSI
jgi:hypothetical protein